MLAEPLTPEIPKLFRIFFLHKAQKLIHAAVLAFRILLPVPSDQFGTHTEDCTECQAVKTVCAKAGSITYSPQETFRPCS